MIVVHGGVLLRSPNRKRTFVQSALGGLIARFFDGVSHCIRINRVVSGDCEAPHLGADVNIGYARDLGDLAAHGVLAVPAAHSCDLIFKRMHLGFILSRCLMGLTLYPYGV